MNTTPFSEWSSLRSRCLGWELESRMAHGLPRQVPERRKELENENLVEKSSISVNVNTPERGASAVGMYHARLRQYEYNLNKRRSRGAVRVNDDWETNAPVLQTSTIGTYYAPVPTFVAFDNLDEKSVRKNQEN